MLQPWLLLLFLKQQGHKLQSVCPLSVQFEKVLQGLEVKMALAQSSKSMQVLANGNSSHAHATAAAAHMCTAQPCRPAPILYPYGAQLQGAEEPYLLSTSHFGPMQGRSTSLGEK